MLPNCPPPSSKTLSVNEMQNRKGFSAVTPQSVCERHSVPAYWQPISTCISTFSPSFCPSIRRLLDQKVVANIHTLFGSLHPPTLLSELALFLVRISHAAFSVLNPRPPPSPFGQRRHARTCKQPDIPTAARFVLIHLLFLFLSLSLILKTRGTACRKDRRPENHTPFCYPPRWTS